MTDMMEVHKLKGLIMDQVLFDAHAKIKVVI